MWIYFMADALQGTSEQKRVAPSGLVTMRVSADSGLAAPAGEPGGIFETFIAGHLPPQTEGEGLAGGTGNPNTPPGETRSEESLF
jgi:membrane carboxypeptidase/penicillin-binding protein